MCSISSTPNTTLAPRLVADHLALFHLKYVMQLIKPFFGCIRCAWDETHQTPGSGWISMSSPSKQVMLFAASFCSHAVQTLMHAQLVQACSTRFTQLSCDEARTTPSKVKASFCGKGDNQLCTTLLLFDTLGTGMVRIKCHDNSQGLSPHRKPEI